MLCKKWVFTKIRINKFIPLAVAIIGFAIQLFVRPEGMVIQMIVMAVTVISFFWFMDIQQTGGPKKSNENHAEKQPVEHKQNSGHHRFTSDIERCADKVSDWPER